MNSQNMNQNGNYKDIDTTKQVNTDDKFSHAISEWLALPDLFHNKLNLTLFEPPMMFPMVSLKVSSEKVNYPESHFISSHICLITLNHPN